MPKKSESLSSFIGSVYRIVWGTGILRICTMLIICGATLVGTSDIVWIILARALEKLGVLERGEYGGASGLLPQVFGIVMVGSGVAIYLWHQKSEANEKTKVEKEANFQRNARSARKLRSDLIKFEASIKDLADSYRGLSGIPDHGYASDKLLKVRILAAHLNKNHAIRLNSNISAIATKLENAGRDASGEKPAWNITVQDLDNYSTLLRQTYEEG